MRASTHLLEAEVLGVGFPPGGHQAVVCARLKGVLDVRVVLPLLVRAHRHAAEMRQNGMSDSFHFEIPLGV